MNICYICNKDIVRAYSILNYDLCLDCYNSLSDHIKTIVEYKINLIIDLRTYSRN